MTIYDQDRHRWEAEAVAAIAVWRGDKKYRRAVDLVINTLPEILQQLDADTQSINGLRFKVKMLSDALNAAGINPHAVLATALKSSSVPLSGEE